LAHDEQHERERDADRHQSAGDLRRVARRQKTAPPHGAERSQRRALGRERVQTREGCREGPIRRRVAGRAPGGEHAADLEAPWLPTVLDRQRADGDEVLRDHRIEASGRVGDDPGHDVDAPPEGQCAPDRVRLAGEEATPSGLGEDDDR